MRKLFICCFLLLSGSLFSQTDTTKWLRAFPITDYMVDISDTVKLVQVQMPDGLSVKEKQLGVLYGVYGTSKETAVEKGYGRCNLIKGDYYYFTIGNNKSGQAAKQGDLLYTMMPKTDIYFGLVPQVALHFIRLLDVYDKPLYDRYNVFLNWTEPMEKSLLDSMVKDIRFTGKYFIENNPSMDVVIKGGEYSGKKTLYVMAECTARDVRNFLNYMVARPRLYAGKDWKISEVFATWLSEGAPMVKPG